MSTELVKKAVEYFNNNMQNELHALWHDDVQVIRLMTNDIILEGKEQLIEINTPYMEEGKVKLKLVNVLDLGDYAVSFMELVGMDIERVTIYQIEDGKFKRSWVSQFKKDEEE